MQRLFLLYLVIIFYTVTVYGSVSSQPDQSYPIEIMQEDSLHKLQELYNGVIWTNKYRRYNGDQFFLTSRFIPGTVSLNGHTYKNLRLKFDILSDEILTPLNNEEVLKLNREMIDSFTLSFENRIYRFINLRNDSAAVINGYCNLLYNGRSALYLKYIKKATTSVTEQSDGEFNQSIRIFVVSGDVIYQVKNTRDFMEIMEKHKDKINEFVSGKKLKLSKNDPGSFIPVLKYYDSINP